MQIKSFIDKKRNGKRKMANSKEILRIVFLTADFRININHHFFILLQVLISRCIYVVYLYMN